MQVTGILLLNLDAIGQRACVQAFCAVFEQFI